MNLQKNQKILKEFRNALFTIYLKDTGILGIDVRSEMTYDTDEVTQIINNTKHIAGENKYLILVTTGPFTATTFDALKRLAAPEALKYAHAKAYVITTITQRLMANFFIHYFNY